MRHRHEDGLHVVAVVAPPLRTLSRRLKQRHGVGVGELLRHFRAHLSGVAQVALVAHKDPRHLVAERVLSAFLDPRREAAETRRARHVVHKHHGVHVSVVVLHHALTETLLTSCVPQLDLKEREGRKN